MAPEATGNSQAPLLEVRDLAVAYQGRARVLHGAGLRIEQRQLVALVGANGAGKSTTLKAISGMLASDQGTIVGGQVLLGGEDVTAEPAFRMVRRGVVHVMEGRFVFPDLTVRENLVMGAYRRAARKRLVDADIQLVLEYFPRLAERMQIRAGYLSGGEQQMLAIGRALMARPRLLLLDEPSMGLSPRLVREVFERIERIRQDQQLTVLLVEQNVRAALRLADHAYVLETGRIVLKGPAATLLDNPQLEQVYLGGPGG